jgi:DNA-binding transcriptional LysR family regulator
MLAACHLTLKLGKGAVIEIGQLSAYPLLLLHTDFMVRRTFDAACRLAGLTPNIRLDSRVPHTLLAMAEAGHGVAIIPSQLQAHRYDLKIVRITYRGKSVREPLAILWDKRRPLPRFASVYCDMLAKYMQEVFPITRPTNHGGQ